MVQQYPYLAAKIILLAAFNLFAMWLIWLLSDRAGRDTRHRIALINGYGWPPATLTNEEIWFWFTEFLFRQAEQKEKLKASLVPCKQVTTTQNYLREKAHSLQE